MADLKRKVQQLFELLDEVEECVNVNPKALDNSVGVKLVDRLYLAADTLDTFYPADKATTLDDLRDDQSKSSSPTERKSPESGVPTPPPVIIDLDDSPSPSPPAVAQPAPSQSVHLKYASPKTYTSLYHPPPEILDEPAKKRRREAEEMVRQLEKPKTYGCGIGYQGDEKERQFTDRAKEKIKKSLPALRTNMHLFHYMVWATTERLECEHCRKCTNTFS